MLSSTFISSGGGVAPVPQRGTPMVPAILGGVSTGISVINSLGLGSEDPQKNAERYATIDTLKRDAIASRSKTSRAYIHLACWAGASIGSPDYNLAVSYGMVEQGGPCRVGSASALVYAKAAKATVDIALAVDNVARPIITDVAIESVKQRISENLPVIIVVVVVVLGLILYARKGGG